jgi:ribokinase
MTAAAVVVGSLNMDLVMRVRRPPEAGETLFGRGFAMAEGGKGGNQAVASARLGASVAMVGRVGADAFGTQLRTALQHDHVDVGHVLSSPGTPTGVAMIMVEDTGENRIILAPGANLALALADIDSACGLVAQARLLVVQLEVPIPAVTHSIFAAARASVPVLCNPAPAQDLPQDTWRHIDYLVPNETEASILTGIAVSDPPSAAEAARVLRGRGVRHVLITLGAQGVFIADSQGERLLPAQKVNVVDTTAAGDCFIGGLVAGLCDGMPLDRAARLGIAAASLSVTRPGAQPSLPTRRELNLNDV